MLPCWCFLSLHPHWVSQSLLAEPSEFYCKPNCRSHALATLASYMVVKK